MELWAIGRHDLGLSSDEFWELTLEEFGALVKRRQIAQRDALQGPILICAALGHKIELPAIDEQPKQAADIRRWLQEAKQAEQTS